MQASYQKHFPVMLPEVLQNLAPRDGEVYVDATFGNGGYTEAVLRAANCKVIAIDRDPTVLPRAKELQDIYGTRFEFKQGCFGQISDLIQSSVDGFMFDIGVSSMQLDQPERGFSFSKTAPLDMRMSCSGRTAADIVNQTDERDLADLIYKYGEERKSRQIASKIAAYRRNKPIETTTELAEIIYSVLHKTPNSIDPATRTFQALRIAVNHELDELENGLKSAVSLLKPQGRIVVVSFHSLEDRIVKNFFREQSGNNANVSRYLPQNTVTDSIALTDVSKAITPSEQELSVNPRSRSAKLRRAVKTNNEPERNA
ncbi:MAG: 16S rRNA (cytosine(1402)-N(4))-methyltransferase RsmH [Alphaproteobacteria bacterium]|nr:16S rRNA (cytosine(1402)-N(4))-methyltransferase RsmH [Alphaproteobacteria bacterium]